MAGRKSETEKEIEKEQENTDGETAIKTTERERT